MMLIEDPVDKMTLVLSMIFHRELIRVTFSGYRSAVNILAVVNNLVTEIFASTEVSQ